jgi:pimeloyl-ACP methyl ester carboxylesterase
LSRLNNVAKGAAVAGALGFGPAVFQTVSHAYGLRKREKAAEQKERMYGCPYPEIPRPSANGRKMQEIEAELREIPFNPRRMNGVTSTLLFALADVIPMVLECRKSTCGLMYRYPYPFRKVVIDSEDGTPLCGVVAVHPDRKPRPALLMVHGLFGSKNAWFSQQVVLSAYYGWGYNVMAIDLRFFGESKRYSDAPGTGGWKEGQDIIAAVKFLKDIDRVTSVAVMGGSYGGAAAMCAAYQSEPKDLIDGGIISWGGYGYVPEQVGFISKVPKPWEPFFPVYLFFAGCFGLTLGSRVFEFNQFEKFLLKHAAPYYGVAPEDLFNRSSAADHFDEIGTPTLVINSQDDPAIPTEQGNRMQEAARGNPWVTVWNMPRGGHCAFATVDKPWMSKVARGFYDYWAKC